MRAIKIYKQNTDTPEVGATKEEWRIPTGGIFPLDLERRRQEAKMAGDVGGGEVG